MLEIAYVGRARPAEPAEGQPERGAGPVVASPTRTSTVRTRRSRPALRDVGQVQSTGILNYHALLVKFQRRFANGFSLLASYTFAKAMDYNSDNDGRVTRRRTSTTSPATTTAPADYDIKHTLEPRAACTSCRWAQDKWYGGWQVSGIVYSARACPLTIRRRRRACCRPGTGNRPNRDRRPGARRTRRSTSGSTRRPSSAPTDTTGTYGDAGRNIMRGPGQFNIDMSLIKYTKFGARQPRAALRGVQPPEPPAVRQRRTRRSATPPSATITAMLLEPVVRALRHDGAQHPVRGEDDVLIG